MPSTINRTLPVQNSPMTSLEMRQQFGRAADDIDALQTGKANLASPALTGTPTAPTAATTVNSTQIATTAFAKAMPITNLQGNPVTAGTPSNGQVLTWGGTAWAPQAATGGVPDPATIALRPMTANMNDWIPIGVAGFFVGQLTSGSVTNGPPSWPGVALWRVTGISDTTGRASLTAEPFDTNGNAYYSRHYSPTSRLIFRRYRAMYGANPGWSGWLRDDPFAWFVFSYRTIPNFTITNSPQMLPDLNVSYRPFSRRHVYSIDNGTFDRSVANTIYLREWEGNFGDPSGHTDPVPVVSGTRLIVDQAIYPNDQIRVFVEEGDLRQLWSDGPGWNQAEVIYIFKSGAPETVPLRITVMGLLPSGPYPA